MRQLPKADLIIDYDEECKVQLTRFGFKVFLYTMSSGNGGNSLGKEMFGWWESVKEKMDWNHEDYKEWTVNEWGEKGCVSKSGFNDNY